MHRGQQTQLGVESILTRSQPRRRASTAVWNVVETFSSMATASPSGQDGITAELIDDDHNARAAYSAIATRAQGYNDLQWQTPNLALVAEAFLLQLALGPQSTPLARVVASALNLMLSLLCIQKMTKHREMQIDDRTTLRRLEKRLGLPDYHRKPDLDRLPGWQRLSSTRLWIIGFWGLALVALCIFVVTSGKFLWDLLESCSSPA
jgi:hypothetical protein